MDFGMKIAGILKSIGGKTKGIITAVQGMSRTQAVIAGVATIVTVGGVATGGYVLHNHFSEPEPVVEAAVVTEEVTEQEETEIETEESIVAEVVMVTEESEAAEAEKVKLVATSIEKDLKIKIQNEKNQNVKGHEFSVSVKADSKKAKATTYKDDDKDGIIYIDEIAAGDYVVSLDEMDGFIIEKNDVTFTVKDKIEYVKVDVVDEVKTESEVSPAEDAETNQVEVEAEVTDTVALIESTCTPQTVSAVDVDTTNVTPAAAVSGTKSASITQNAGTASRNKTVYSGTSETTTGTSETVPGTSETVPGTSETVPGTSETTPPTETNEKEYVCVYNYYVDGTLVANEKATTKSTEQSVTFKYTDAPSYQTYAGKYAFDKADSDQTAAENTSATINIYWKTKAVALTATYSVPETATLYKSDVAASKSIGLQATVSDTSGIITGVSWASSDTKVVTVSGASASGCTITAAGEGTATVTATITYLGYAGNKTDTLTTTVSTAVTVSAGTDGTAVLKDKSGRTLYKDAECKTVATVADYSASGTYYTDPVYTGWQTIDGDVYYFDSNHKPVTGKQVIGGTSYTFREDGTLSKGTSATGIDVSKYQGTIDWSAVKAAGIEFAIIRVGYRGSQTGVLVEDPYFKQNIKGATAAGIKVGVYFFTQAITEAEAVEEASMVLSLISGYKLKYPVFIDTENGSGNARANGLDKATRTACISAFCKTIQNGGRTAGIYASKSWYNTKLDMSQLNGYCIWVAQYNTSCTYTGKYSIWQYTSKGSVPGIKGYVDMNISYM